MKISSLRTVLLAVLAALSSAPVLAHEGHQHHVMGTVASIDAGRIEVATADGKSAVIGLTERTKVLRGKAPAKVADIKKGARVVVETEGTPDKVTATVIRLSAEAK